MDPHIKHIGAKRIHKGVLIKYGPWFIFLTRSSLSCKSSIHLVARNPYELQLRTHWKHLLDKGPRKPTTWSVWKSRMLRKLVKQLLNILANLLTKLSGCCSTNYTVLFHR